MINDALKLADIDFGSQNSNNIQEQSLSFINERSDLEAGWAQYPKNKWNGMQMNSQLMQLLNTLFIRGNKHKSWQYTADRAQLIL